MLSREFILRNTSGLHARPATVFVQTCGRLQSNVRVANLNRGEREVNGKSILEVLTLGAGPGHRIRVVVDGADEQSAMEQLTVAIDAGLGEDLTSADTERQP
jgi:phosphotransferase system HPr (HPr) family protein